MKGPMKNIAPRIPHHARGSALPRTQSHGIYAGPAITAKHNGYASCPLVTACRAAGTGYLLGPFTGIPAAVCCLRIAPGELL